MALGFSRIVFLGRQQFQNRSLLTGLQQFLPCHPRVKTRQCSAPRCLVQCLVIGSEQPTITVGSIPFDDSSPTGLWPKTYARPAFARQYRFHDTRTRLLLKCGTGGVGEIILIDNKKHGSRFLFDSQLPCGGNADSASLDLNHGSPISAGLELVRIRAALDVNQIAGLQVISADANLLTHLWSSLPISLNRV